MARYEITIVSAAHNGLPLNDYVNAPNGDAACLLGLNRFRRQIRSCEEKKHPGYPYLRPAIGNPAKISARELTPDDDILPITTKEFII